MRKIGIIAEYNPFHNGHIYHIQKIKELYPDSLLILVLNGYFLERGEISVISKENKTKLALKNDIDIVLELPVIYGTQSSDTFAEASINILQNFQIEEIIFGSESTNIEKIQEIAKEQIEKKFTFKIKDKTQNYPTLLAKNLNIPNIIPPNDLLAISYCKAIFKNHYSIKTTPILRTSSYHNITSSEPIISASNIRHKRKNQENIHKYLPADALNSWQEVDMQKLFEFLKYRILTDNHLDSYIDVTEGLDFKMKKEIKNAKNYEEFIKNLKSKRYTYNRINRMLIHVLLGHQKKIAKESLSYIKVLGFSKKGQEYLNSIRKNIQIPLTPIKDSIQYQEEIKASLLYDMLTHSQSSLFDIQNKPVIYTKETSKESNQK